MSASYCTGGWHFMKPYLCLATLWENKHARIFLRLRRKPTDDNESFNKRTAIVIRGFRQSQGGTTAPQNYEILFMWAYDWWHLTLEDGTAWFRDLMMVSIKSDCKMTQDSMSQIDTKHTTQWKHRCKGNPDLRTRWESTRWESLFTTSC